MDKTVTTGRLLTNPPFSTLFPIEKAVLDAVRDSIRYHGYDASKTIDVWRHGGRYVVVDGHTRLEAARAAELAEVDIFEHDFPDEEDALAYAIHNQRDRRNLGAEEIMNCVRAPDETRRRARGGDRRSADFEASREASNGGKSAEQAAAIIGISRATVERARAVDADPEARQAVEDGKSIDAAYRELRTRMRDQQLGDADRAALLPTPPDANGHAPAVLTLPPVEAALLLAKARLGHGRFGQWVAAEFGWTQRTATNFMNVAGVFGGTWETVSHVPPTVLYALSADSVSDKLRKRLAALAADGEKITPEAVAVAAAEDDGDDRDPTVPGPIAAALDRAAVAGKFTLAEWAALDAPTRRLLIEEAPAWGGKRRRFTPTNENVDWARWTWNPVTGCLHDCPYCYARDLAARFYDQGFAPTFIPERLHAPRYTPLPDQEPGESPAGSRGEGRARNVFVGSMADLFGKWVPQEWIDAVFAEVLAAPDWRFLFLTKFPRKLAEQAWPPNAWVGTSVDRQFRVEIAEKAFRDVEAGVKWLSCEPLLEPLRFSSLAMFDWVVIGGESSNTHNPKGFDPPWEWIEDLYRQAREAGCRVYFKENLRNRPKELPTVIVP